MKILAIDCASCLGWAVGDSAGDPRSGFIHLGGKDADRDGKFSGAIQWMNKMMREEKPDRVVIEAPFLNQEKTSMAQLELSYGLQGNLLGVARLNHCFKVKQINVNLVQSYFVPQPPAEKGAKKPKLESGQKKILIRRRCIELGWTTEDDTNLDQTDACALWAFAVGKYDQPNSIRFSPLFTKA